MAAQPTSPRLNSKLAPAAVGTPSAAATAAEAIVDAIVIPRLESAAPIVTAAPLVGESTPAYNAEERFKEAKKFLDANEKNSARLIFSEIIERLKTNPATAGSLLMAGYKIGLAFTYPIDSTARSEAASNAKTLCEQNFEKRDSWNTENKKANYTLLIENYNALLSVLQPKDPAKRTIGHNIRACEREAKALESTPPPVLTEASPAPAAAADKQTPPPSPAVERPESIAPTETSSPAPKPSEPAAMPALALPVGAALPPPPIEAPPPPPESTLSAAPEPDKAASSSTGRNVAFAVPFDAKASYIAARSYLSAEKYVEAHKHFTKILTNLVKDEPTIEDLLIIAGSHLGIALTYNNPLIKKDGVNLAFQKISETFADQTCDTIYQRLESAITLDIRKKIAYYQGLSEHYSSLRNMLPEDDQAKKRLAFCKGQVDSLKAALTSAPPKGAAHSSGAAPAAAAAPSPSASGDKHAPPPQPPAPAPKVPPIKTAALNASSPAHTPVSGEPASAAQQSANAALSPRKAAAPDPVSPRRVTPGPVGSSSRIRFVFGLSMVAILAAIVGVVIYNRRWVVKK